MVTQVIIRPKSSEKGVTMNTPGAPPHLRWFVSDELMWLREMEEAGKPLTWWEQLRRIYRERRWDFSRQDQLTVLVELDAIIDRARRQQ